MTNAHSQSGVRLLIVDDDPNMVLLTKEYLELKGFEVMTAESGLEGIAILERETPDLIICDMMMPGMNGSEFVRQVKTDPHTRGIPILFLSASSRSQDRVEGLNAGATAYMLKPFEPEELVAQVQAILAACRRQSPTHSQREPT